MLVYLALENFRCINSAHLELDPDGTGIIGPNASGKTSLLEAAYYLGHGRSFRTNTSATLVGPAGTYFRVVGGLSGAGGITVAGVEYQAGKTRVRLGGREAGGISAIAELLPLQVIDPGIHRLIEEGSTRRRRQLDWGVFHVEPQFLPTWRRYQRALAQRNAALRSASPWSSVEIWDAVIVKDGALLDEMRGRYSAQLQSYFRTIATQLVGPGVTLEYYRGWNELALEAALERAKPRDLSLRATTVGPHRADLRFEIDGRPARERVSRGQQKMLAAALVLAQTLLRHAVVQGRACLLLDDPAAELDVDNLGKLLAVVATVPAQLITTAVSREGLRGIKVGRMFHVEQGDFRPVL